MSQPIYGIRAILEAVHAGKTIDKVMLLRGVANPLIAELKGACQEQNIPVKIVDEWGFKAYQNRNHQGAVAEMSPIEFQDLEAIVQAAFEAGQDPLILALDNITDVRNFGAICRTAEVAGAHAVLIPAIGGAQVGEDAIKTSAGALNHLNLCRTESLVGSISLLKESGLRIIACTEKTNKSLYDTELKGPCVLVMGSEDKGISGSLLKMADEKVSIPQYGKIESLNVSVATGIALYEILRQRT